MTAKRIFDVGFSALALTALAPLMTLIAAAVWVDSGRPVLFSQIRVGRDFQPFSIRKFRTMRVSKGLPITSGNDVRITRVGRFLRRAKLDEFPQLWNVLTGSMSLVGPRPELPQFVEQFRRRYQNVLSVRPGMTDPASLRYWNEEQMLARVADPVSFYTQTVLPAKLELAEGYVCSRCIAVDCAVLLRTAANLLRGAFGI